MAAHPDVATGPQLPPTAWPSRLSTRLAQCVQVPRGRRPCVSRWRASLTVACALTADEVPAQSSRDDALPSQSTPRWSGPDDVALPRDLRQAPRAAASTRGKETTASGVPLPLRRCPRVGPVLMVMAAARRARAGARTATLRVSLADILNKVGLGPPAGAWDENARGQNQRGGVALRALTIQTLPMESMS
jgi:hypothetical protein